MFSYLKLSVYTKPFHRYCLINALWLFLSLLYSLFQSISWMYIDTIIKHTCWIWWYSHVVPSLFLYYLSSSVPRKNIWILPSKLIYVMKPPKKGIRLWTIIDLSELMIVLSVSPFVFNYDVTHFKLVFYNSTEVSNLLVIIGQRFVM